MNKLQFRLSLVALLFLFSTSAPAATLDFSQIFVIGDSLSDSGNVIVANGGMTTNPPYTDLIPSAPYSSGRFSNGPVWIEQLAGRLGSSVQASLTGGTGYAFGGARSGPLTGIPPSLSPTLIDQKELLLGTFGALPGDALYVVWGGSNDVRDAVVAANAAQTTRIISDALDNVGTVISALAGAGAQHFLIPNIPDLSLTPAVKAAAQDAGALEPLVLAAFRQASMAFNDGLGDSVLPGLEAGFDIDVTEVDIATLITEAVASPGEFGLSNASDTCIILGGDSCSTPDEYLFWDGLHPTTAAHALVSELAYDRLTSVPLPAALPMFASGFAFFSIYSRKRGSLTDFSGILRGTKSG